MMSNKTEQYTSVTKQNKYAKVHVIDRGMYVGATLMGIEKLISLAKRGRVRRTLTTTIVELN